MFESPHLPDPIRVSQPRWMHPLAVMALSLVVVAVLAIVGWLAVSLAQPSPILSGPLPQPYDAFTMQQGLLGSVVPLAAATLVRQDREAAFIATNVAYTEQRMGAVATEVRRDSLNNVDGLSTRVALFDLKLDNHVRLDHPAATSVAVEPPDGLPPYLGPRDGR